jgi:CDP-diacylglycerol---glycerol-3-phosphate 3-phosphatidyltransferase
MLDGRWRAKVERGLAPVGKGLERAGITADFLTLVGLACSVGTAFLIAAGELRWAVLGVIASGVPDVLDGSVARHSNKASPRGAFFDSVADRISDAVLLGGVAWYLAGQSAYLPLLAFAVAALSTLVSYERAKAEALGFSARGGLMERAERLVLISIGLCFHVLVPVLWLMAALTAITAVHRFARVWQQASDRPAPQRRVRASRHRRAGGPDDELEGGLAEIDLAAGDEAGAFTRWWEARRPVAARWRWRHQDRPRRRTRP